ncbi:hypothetical protein [Streptomyces sp. NPDC054838]
MTTTPAADTITIRVPGAFGRAWDRSRGDDAHNTDPDAAVYRDIAAAWTAAREHSAGKGTVRVMTISRILAGAFLELAGRVAETELGGGTDGADTAAGRAGYKMLERAAQKGLTPAWPAEYRLTDPAAQSALEAEIMQAAERWQQETKHRAAEQERTAAYQALGREERRTLDARVLALGLEHLGAPAPEGRRTWMEYNGLAVSVLRGSLAVEPSRRAGQGDATGALDAARTALTVRGWCDRAGGGGYIDASHPDVQA